MPYIIATLLTVGATVALGFVLPPTIGTAQNKPTIVASIESRYDVTLDTLNQQQLGITGHDPARDTALGTSKVLYDGQVIEATLVYEDGDYLLYAETGADELVDLRDLAIER